MAVVSLLGILMCTAFFGSLMFVLWQKVSAQCKAYLESHPPISDEEFVKLCKPGTVPAIAIKVRQIIAETLCVEKDRIYPDDRFIDDLGAG